MKTRKRHSRNKTFANIGSRASVDTKLTAEAMLIQLMFDYGINPETRTINLTGEVNEIMYDLFEIGMTYLESKSKATITVKINSPGGSTYDAMGIISRLKESKCKVVTKGYGHVMSAATLILASGDKRMMSSEAFLMWHEASYDISGRHSSNKALVDQVSKEEAFWADRMAERSNKDAKYWRECGIHVDAYFTADQLLELGVIDEIF